MKEKILNALTVSIIATGVVTLILFFIPTSSYVPDVGPFTVIPAEYSIYGYPFDYKIVKTRGGQDTPLVGDKRPFAGDQIGNIQFDKLANNVLIYLVSFFILSLLTIEIMEKRKK